MVVSLLKSYPDIGLMLTSYPAPLVERIRKNEPYVPLVRAVALENYEHLGESLWWFVSVKDFQEPDSRPPPPPPLLQTCAMVLKLSNLLSMAFVTVSQPEMDRIASVPDRDL